MTAISVAVGVDIRLVETVGLADGVSEAFTLLGWHKGCSTSVLALCMMGMLSPRVIHTAVKLRWIQWDGDMLEWWSVPHQW